jgi:hypothetical protein
MNKNYLTLTLKSMDKPVTKLNSFFIFIAFFYGISLSLAQSPQTYTTSGTWVCPQGVTSVRVEAWGGGAGGASTPNSNNSNGGGGGGGAYSIRNSITVVPGTSYNFTIGNGGGQDANGGNTTATINGVVITAAGGSTGASSTTVNAAGGAGGTVAASVGDTRYAGGNGANGAYRPGGNNTGNGGGGGSGAGTLGAGNNGAGTTGGTLRANFGGQGGNGGANADGSNASTAAGNYGGGGGGAGHKNNNAGLGARGAMIFTYTCPALVSNAGPDQNLAACSTTTTLAANTPVNATGIWTVVSGSGTVTTPSSPTSGVTGIVPGGAALILRWTVSNGNCGSINTTVSITSPIGPGCLVYCTPVGSNANAFGHITNVNVNAGAINRASAYDGYINTGLSTTLMKGFTYTMTIGMSNSSTTGRWTAAWADWNINGVLNDAGENIGPAAISTASPTDTRTITFTVPAGASSGVVKLRVVHTYEGTIYAAPTPCAAAYASQSDWEDYTFNVIDPPACVAPTAQPTGLALTPAGTTIAGGFIAASPAADNYLVIVSTNPVAPSAPVNGTTYTIGSVYQAGYTVVDNDNNTTFTATGLTTLTTYYFYIYSFNSLCTGGPRYLGSSPLTGNTTTTNVDYCTPTISNAFQTATTHHIRKVEFIGTLQDIVNISTFPTVAPFGYTNFTGLATKAIQAKGEGVNIYMESPTSGYIKAWVDWNKDGDFLDAGETVYDAGGVAQASTTLGFIVPTGIAVGDYRVRLRTSGRNIAGSDAGFAWDSCTTNLAYYGETEDYILTVIENCAARIATVTEGSVCGSGTVNLSVTGSGSPTGYNWYAAQTGGAPLATTVAGSWTTPSISTTTTYYITAINGTCETLVRTKIRAFVKPIPTLSFATSTTEVCGENSTVALTATGTNEIVYLLDEKFEGGMGTFSNVHYVSNAAVNATTAWQVQTSPYIPTGLTWYPAIQSNFGTNNFAFVNSDIGQSPSPPGSYYTIDNGLVSNTVNSTNFLDLTLKFRAYYDRYFPDTVNPAAEYMTVDVSTNGGGAWTPVSGNIINDIGYGTRFTEYSYDLSAYINQANLKVRIRYFTNTWCNGAAIDDIELYGLRPLTTALNWNGVPLPDVYTDPATTIPYIAGTPATIVYVKPNLTQLENGSYTFTATASLTNGCNVSQNITINNKSTIWKGTVSNDWNNPNNWSPAIVPDINACVIIPTAPSSSNIIGASYNAFGKTLIVKNGGVLDIQPNNTLTIANTVTVDAGGTFNLENASSLVQIDNVANVGNITMRRTAVAGALDYVYWSTPVAGFSINNVLPTAGVNRYLWNPTVNNGGTYAGNFGNWSVASGAMTTGRGYIKLGSGGTTSFVGNPNNGNISIPITRGTYNGGTYAGPTTTLVTADDDNWNLLGNPYPSAISATDFLAANPGISGFVKVWSHGTLPVSAVDPFYQDFMLNYTTSDYITTNGVGSTPPGYDGRIGAGQGFFVLMNHATATPGTVVFNNTMRSNAYRNDQFYRSGNEIEKHRLWVDLVSPTNNSSSTLVGYVTDATNSLDNMYDAIAQGVKSNFEIYSIADSQELIIQGRSLPFNQNDEVTLGVSIPQNGIYTIAISNVDGMFTDVNQKIYLEDKQLGIFHNLRSAPYTFTGTVGRDENRFVLLYNSSRLSQDDVNLTNNVLVATNENVTVYSSTESIDNIEVYDLLGKLVRNYSNINSSEFILNNLNKNDTTLLLKIKLNNGSIVNKKIIF